MFIWIFIYIYFFIFLFIYICTCTYTEGAHTYLYLYRCAKTSHYLWENLTGKQMGISTVHIPGILVCVAQLFVDVHRWVLCHHYPHHIPRRLKSCWTSELSWWSGLVTQTLLAQEHRKVRWLGTPTEAWRLPGLLQSERLTGRNTLPTVEAMGTAFCCECCQFLYGLLAPTMAHDQG